MFLLSLLIILVFIICCANTVQADGYGDYPPPDDGDWTIGKETYVGNETIDLYGNLIIQDGGKLTLKNVDLVFHGQEPGDYGIDVQDGGSLSVLDLDDDPKTTNDRTHITASEKSNEFNFLVQEGATFLMRNSELSESGNQWSDDGSSGLTIKAENARVEQSNIHDCYFGVHVVADSVRITNCEITDNAEYGIYTFFADKSVISGCRIQDNGNGMSVQGDHNTINDCLVETNVFTGISVSGNYVNITKCRSQSNAFDGFNIMGMYINVIDCNATQNGNGFNLMTVQHSTIRNSSAYKNFISGIYLDYSSMDNELIRCNVSESYNGIYTGYSYAANNLTSCNAWKCTYGFILNLESGNLENCRAWNNGWGFNLTGSGNTLDNCIAWENNYGFDLTSWSNNNQYLDCRAWDNEIFDFRGQKESNRNVFGSFTLGKASTPLSFTYGDGIGILMVQNPPPDHPDLVSIDKYADLNRLTTASWINVKFHYKDEELEDIDEATLELWRYDDGWSEVEGSELDTRQNTVSANITDFSVFAVLGQIKAEENVENLETEETFATIQEAIDDEDTEDGHTLIVHEHTYSENVVVYKQLILRGAAKGKDIPIIDAMGGVGIAVEMEGVRLENLTIFNATTGCYVFNDDGGISGVTLWNLTAYNNDIGIGIEDAEESEVIESHLHNNTETGIILTGSRYCTVTKCELKDNWDDGILLEGSEMNTVSWNSLSKNGFSNIALNGENNEVHNNSIITLSYRQDWGIHFTGPASYNNMIVNNTVNGYYYYHIHKERGTTNDPLVYENLDAQGWRMSNIGNIFIGKSENITLRHVVVRNNSYSANRGRGDFQDTYMGLYIDSSKNILVEDLTSEKNNIGIVLENDHDIKFDGLLCRYNTNGLIVNLSSDIHLDEGNISDNNAIGLKIEDTKTIQVNMCDVMKNNIGVMVQRSDMMMLNDTHISDNRDRGILARKSNFLKIVNCSVESNVFGIEVNDSTDMVVDISSFNDNDYALFLYDATNARIINTTILGEEATDLELQGKTSTITMGLSFKEENINIADQSALIVRNFLRIHVQNTYEDDIQGADIRVTDNDDDVYASPGYGGNDPATDVFGMVGWIVVTDRIYNGSSGATENETKIWVSHDDEEKSRTVSMKDSHLESFSFVVKLRAVIDSMENNPANEGESVDFEGHGEPGDNIDRFVWRSNLDGEFYNGTDDTISYNLLTVGNHTIYFKVRDTQRVWSPETSGTLEIKNILPTPVIHSIDPSPANEGDAVLFNGSGSDVRGVILAQQWSSSIDGDLSTKSIFSTTNLTPGNHTISFRVQDDELDWSGVISRQLTIENVLPIAVIEGVSTLFAQEGEPVTFNGSGSDVVGVILAYRWNSSLDGTINTSATFTTSSLQPGVHTITLEVQDDEGAWSPKETEEVMINAPPEAEIVSILPESPEEGDNITFTGRGIDTTGNISTYEWSTIGLGVMDENITFSTEDLPLGDYTISFRVMDEFAVWSEPVTQDIEIQNALPTPIIHSIDPSPANEGDDILFNGSGSDARGVILDQQWTSSIDGNLSNDAIFSSSNLSPGNHTISFRVQDDELDWSGDVSRQLIIENVQPTAVIESVSMLFAQAGEPVLFNGSGSDVVGEITGYRWNSSLDGIIGISPSFITSTLQPGSHTISLVVQDDEGTWSPEEIVEIMINAPPEAEIVSIIPVSPVEGDTITFTGRAVDTTGNITSYVWSIIGLGVIDENLTFSRADLPIGNHTISFRAMDEFEVWSEPAVQNIEIKNALPVAIIESIDPLNALPGDEITFTGSGSDPVGGIMMFDWSSSLDGPLDTLATFSTTDLSPGNHTITFMVMDDEYEWSIPVTEILLISSPPTAEIISVIPTMTQEGDEVNLTGQGDDEDGLVIAYEWSSDLQGILSFNASYITSGLLPGNHTLLFRVQDDVGLWSQPEGVLLEVVNVQPTALIDSILPSTATEGDEVSFTGSGYDAIGPILAYQWSSSNDGPLDGNATFVSSTLSPGNHLISLIVMDDENTWSEPATQAVFINLRPMAEIISQDPTDPDEGDGITLTGKGTDPDSSIAVYEWTIVGDTRTGDAATFTFSLEPGTYTIRFRVQDEHGAWSDPAEIIVVIDNILPTASIDSIVPSSGNESDPVKFTGSGTDIQGVITGYRWSSDSDGFLDGNASFTIATLSPGDHTISFEVRDDENEWSLPVTQLVSINARPTAELESVIPEILTIGQVLSFNGTGFDPDGNITAYEWYSDLQGVVSTSTTLQSSELEPGTHTITFRVRDDKGAWSEPETGTIRIISSGPDAGKDWFIITLHEQDDEYRIQIRPTALGLLHLPDISSVLLSVDSIGMKRRTLFNSAENAESAEGEYYEKKLFSISAFNLTNDTFTLNGTWFANELPVNKYSIRIEAKKDTGETLNITEKSVTTEHPRSTLAPALGASGVGLMAGGLLGGSGGGGKAGSGKGGKPKGTRSRIKLRKVKRQMIFGLVCFLITLLILVLAFGYALMVSPEQDPRENYELFDKMVIQNGETFIGDLAEMLPFLIIMTIIIISFRFLVDRYSAHVQEITSAFRLQKSGVVAIIMSTALFGIPFGYPAQSIHDPDQATTAKEARIAITRINGLFILILPFYFAREAYADFRLMWELGITLVLMYAFYNAFPLGQTEGKMVWRQNRQHSIGLFLLTAFLYYYWLIVPVHQEVILAMGIASIGFMPGLLKPVREKTATDEDLGIAEGLGQYPPCSFCGKPMDPNIVNCPVCGSGVHLGQNDLHRFLMENLRSQDPQIRSATVTALKNNLSNRADFQPLVMQALSDGDGSVREAAVKTLVPLLADQGDIIGILDSMLGDQFPLVRTAVIEVLAPYISNNPEIFSHMEKALFDNDEQVQFAAIKVLAPFLPQRADLLKQFETLMDDPVEGIQMIVQESILPLLGNNPWLKNLLFRKKESPMTPCSDCGKPMQEGWMSCPFCGGGKAGGSGLPSWPIPGMGQIPESIVPQTPAIRDYLARNMCQYIAGVPVREGRSIMITNQLGEELIIHPDGLRVRESGNQLFVSMEVETLISGRENVMLFFTPDLRSDPTGNAAFCSVMGKKQTINHWAAQLQAFVWEGVLDTVDQITGAPIYQGGFVLLLESLTMESSLAAQGDQFLGGAASGAHRTTGAVVSPRSPLSGYGFLG